MTDAPEANTKGLATRVKEIIVNDIFTADIIDKTTADRLEAKQAPTQTDSDQLDRFKTTVMTGIDKISSDDVKNFVSGAMKQLINHETAHAALFECRQFDTKNSFTENKSTSKVSTHELFNFIIKPILDDGIVIDNVTAAKFCELLKENAAELAANDLGDYTAKTFKRPVRVLGNFIRLYGYKVEQVSNTHNEGKTFKIVTIEHIERYAKQRKHNHLFAT